MAPDWCSNVLPPGLGESFNFGLDWRIIGLRAGFDAGDGRDFRAGACAPKPRKHRFIQRSKRKACSWDSGCPVPVCGVF